MLAPRPPVCRVGWKHGCEGNSRRSVGAQNATGHLRMRSLVGAYVPVNGHPTWVEEAGAGTPVLLLHGAFSNCEGLFEIFASLASDYRLIAFDRRGHGRTADTDAPFHYADMMTETVGVLEQAGGDAAHVVGYSDGGIIALLLAFGASRSRAITRVDRHELSLRRSRAGRVRRLRSRLRHLRLPATRLCRTFARRRRPLCRRRGQRGGDVTTEPTLTTDDLALIPMPALVLVGDDDLIVPAHTRSLYESLPKGQLAVVPGASHILPYEKPALVAQLVGEFLALVARSRR